VGRDQSFVCRQTWLPAYLREHASRLASSGERGSFAVLGVVESRAALSGLRDPSTSGCATAAGAAGLRPSNGSSPATSRRSACEAWQG
jgi:hypothetical protein